MKPVRTRGRKPRIAHDRVARSIVVTPTLTLDAPPTAVLAMARILARTRGTWGSLETADFVGAACLAFYEKRAVVATRARDFHALMVRYMESAMRDQTRKEATAQGYDRPRVGSRDSVQGFASANTDRTGKAPAGGASASPLTESAKHRRLVAQREHNRTYYYRTVGLQACTVCGVHVERGHGATRCQAHMTALARSQRQVRARRKLLQEAGL